MVTTPSAAGSLPVYPLTAHTTRTLVGIVAADVDARFLSWETRSRTRGIPGRDWFVHAGARSFD
ncbi:MAG: hypothetical protein R3E12_15750 [Candidatus Eisenbacteria bacterium]|uniref:Uncharacterized protein n=1 Tax=Eiseniibacteriota bacterium TaxID=2212470 RepID=A0A956RMY2_UNCEI|nr:hypothetical protein [Candidatus Eisenbacteria bacterium]